MSALITMSTIYTTPRESDKTGSGERVRDALASEFGDSRTGGL